MHLMPLLLLQVSIYRSKLLFFVSVFVIDVIVIGITLSRQSSLAKKSPSNPRPEKRDACSLLCPKGSTWRKGSYRDMPFGRAREQLFEREKRLLVACDRSTHLPSNSGQATLSKGVVEKPVAETEVFNHPRVVGRPLVVHWPASADELKLEAQDGGGQDEGEEGGVGAEPGLVEQAPRQVLGSPCPVLATSVRKMPSRPFDESNINVMKVQL